MTKKRKKTHNPTRPPRRFLTVLVRPKLYDLLVENASQEQVSISKLLNDWLCDAFEIPLKER
jgi:predicted HicB family RNase H-like nuclease